MNLRTFIEFWKRPLGRFLLFGAGAALLIVFFGRKHAEPLPVRSGPEPVTRSQVTTYTSSIAPAPRVRPPEPPKPVSVPPVVVDPAPLNLDLYTSKQKTLGEIYAPYGRLLRCELVVTVDSSKIETPIIGLVTEDLWHNGRLVIPAGTEVHGTAQVDRSRERIASQNRWTLVWQDGRELPVNGLALDHAPDPDGRGWSITDGSAGLRGEIIKSDKWADVKLFAATALSAAAQGFMGTTSIDTAQGNLVTRTQGGAQSALSNATSAVLNRYATEILQKIQEDGFFVRVPAGTTFYLYVTQTLDESQAQVAASSRSNSTHP